jgi:hypothetical protein
MFREGYVRMVFMGRTVTRNSGKIIFTFKAKYAKYF